MTKEEFVQKHKHEISGMILEAAVAEHKGAGLGLFARFILKRVDIKLAEMFDEISPAPPLPLKGTKNEQNGTNGRVTTTLTSAQSERVKP